MLDWKTFLSRWSRELMNTELASRVEPRPDSPDWLGYAPASEEEIRKLEARLGLALPPSYRAFLLTSNGWRRTTSFIGSIRPVGEVTWLRLEDRPTHVDLAAGKVWATW
jgi:cell wall assembly regulator SMI1